MANTVDPDETAHYEPSHLDLQCLHTQLLLCLALYDERFLSCFMTKPVFTVSDQILLRPGSHLRWWKAWKVAWDFTFSHFHL